MLRQKSIVIYVQSPVMNKEAEFQNYGYTFFTLYFQELKILKRIHPQYLAVKKITYHSHAAENRKEFLQYPTNLCVDCSANVEFSISNSGYLDYDAKSRQFTAKKRPSLLEDKAYWIGLSIEKQKNKTIFIQQIFSGNRKIFRGRYTFGKDKTMDGVRTLARDVRRVFSRDKIFYTFTSDPAEARVYLENTYIGKTPVEIGYLSEGRYTLKLLKKEYYPVEKSIVLKKSQNEVYIEMKKIASPGSLYLVTSEPGMDIYLDNLYMGKTPKKITGLELKTYTVALKKKDYMQKNLRVQLSKDSPEKNIRVTIEKGNLKEKWDNRSYFIKPVTYDHMVKGHLILAGSAFLSYLYFIDRYDRKEDYLYSHYLNLSVDETNADVRSLRNDLDLLKKGQDISLGIVIYGIVGSIYFYWKKIDSLDPFGSFSPQKESSVNFYSGMGHSGNISAGWRYVY